MKLIESVLSESEDDDMEEAEEIGHKLAEENKNDKKLVEIQIEENIEDKIEEEEEMIKMIHIEPVQPLTIEKNYSMIEIEVVDDDNKSDLSDSEGDLSRKKLRREIENLQSRINDFDSKLQYLDFDNPQSLKLIQNLK